MNKKIITKPWKIKKMFAVLAAVGFLTFASLNVAKADTNIADYYQLRDFISEGSGTGNVTADITATGNIGTVAVSDLTLNGNSHFISGNNTYSGFEIGNTITSFTLDNININNSATDYFGGAINNAGTITNLNAGFSYNEAGYNGGAIYSTGTIKSVSGTFDHNKANFGGGAIYGLVEKIKDATFLYNTSEFMGGAINTADDDGNLQTITSIIGSTFSNNKNEGDNAGDGGAIYSNVDTIEDCVFSYNESGANGYGGGAVYGDVTTIIDSTFSNNSALTGDEYYGGALYLTGSETTIKAVAKNTVFENNVAEAGSDIYMESTGTLNLLANNGKTISFGGDILGEEDLTININNGSDYTGTVTFGGDLSANDNLDINIYNGTTSLTGTIGNVRDLTIYTNGKLIASAANLNITNGITNNGSLDFTNSTFNSVKNTKTLDLNYTADKTFTTTITDDTTPTGITNISVADGKTVTITSGTSGITQDKLVLTGAGHLTMGGGNIIADVENRMTGSTFELRTTIDGDFDNTNGNAAFMGYYNNDTSTLEYLAGVTGQITNTNGTIGFYNNGNKYYGSGFEIQEGITGDASTVANNILNIGGNYNSTYVVLNYFSSKTIVNQTINIFNGSNLDVSNGSITNSVITIESGGVLTVSASKLDTVGNTISNNGELYLYGDGTNNNSITGSGTTEINKNIIQADGRVIENAISIYSSGSDGSLTTSADNIGNVVTLYKGGAKNSTLALTGGTLTKSVTVSGSGSGKGNVNITGATTIGANGSIASEVVTTINSALTVDGGELTLSNTDNLNAQTTLTSGTLNIIEIDENDPAGITANGGTLNISGDYTILNVNSSIAEAVTTNINGMVEIKGATVGLNTGDGWNSDVRLTSGNLTLTGRTDTTGGTQTYNQSGGKLTLNNSSLNLYTSDSTITDNSKVDLKNAGKMLFYNGASNASVITTTDTTANELKIFTGSNLELKSGSSINNEAKVEILATDLARGTLTIDDGSTVNLSKTTGTADNWQGTITNSGTLNLTNMEKVTTGILTQTTGSTNVLGNTNVFNMNNAGDSITGGTLTVGAGTGYSVTDNKMTVSAGTLTTGATNAKLVLNSDATLDITGGSVTLDGGNSALMTDSQVQWKGDVVLNGTDAYLTLSNIKDDSLFTGGNKTGKLTATKGHLIINSGNVLLGGQDSIAEAVVLTTYSDITVGIGSSLALEGTEWQAGKITVAGGTLSLNGVTTVAGDTPAESRALDANTGILNFTGGTSSTTTLANGADEIAKDVTTNIGSNLTINNTSSNGIVLNDINEAGGDAWTTGAITLNGGNLTLDSSTLTADRTTLKYFQKSGSTGTLNLINGSDFTIAGTFGPDISMIGGGTVDISGDSKLTFKNRTINRAILKMTGDNSELNLSDTNTDFYAKSGTSITGGKITVGDGTNGSSFSFLDGATMTGGNLTVKANSSLGSIGSAIQVAVTNDGTYRLRNGTVAANIADAAGTGINGILYFNGSDTNTVNNGVSIIQKNITVNSQLTNNGGITSTGTFTQTSADDSIDGTGNLTVNNATFVSGLEQNKLTVNGTATLDGVGIALNKLKNNGIINMKDSSMIEVTAQDTTTGAIAGIINVQTGAYNGLSITAADTSGTNDITSAINISDGATLQLLAGDILNTATITSNANSILDIQGGSAVLNGTGSNIDTWNGEVALNDGTLTVNQIAKATGAKLTANTGNLNIEAGSQGLVLNNAADTIADTVVVNIKENAELELKAAGATVTLNAVETAPNEDDIWNGAITMSNGTLTITGLTSRTREDETSATKTYNQTGGTLNLENAKLTLNAGSKITGSTVNLDPSTLIFQNGVANDATFVTDDSSITVGDGSSTVTTLTVNSGSDISDDATVTVKANSILNSASNYIKALVTNNGTYNLTDGEIVANIAGADGTLNIKKGSTGITTNNAATPATITQKLINVETDVTFDNDGAVTSALDNSGTITGDGSWTINADSVNNYDKSITQKSIKVNEDVTFANEGGYINAAIDNSGIIDWDDYSGENNSILTMTGDSTNRTGAEIYQDHVIVNTNVKFTNDGFMETYMDLVNKGTIDNNGYLELYDYVKNSGTINTSVSLDHFYTSDAIQNSGTFKVIGGDVLDLDFVGLDSSTTGIVEISNNPDSTTNLNMNVKGTLTDNTLKLTEKARNLTFDYDAIGGTYYNEETALAGGHLHIAENYAGVVDLTNGNYKNLNMGKLKLDSSGAYVNMDSSLPLETMDAMYITDFENTANNMMTINPNLPSNTMDILTNSNITLYPIDQAVIGTTRYNFAQSINAVLPNEIVSPIYLYTPSYNNTDGTISVVAHDYNPAVLSSSIGAQVGAYLTQINTYEQAFANMDQTMLMTSSQRRAMKLANKYASTQGAGNGGVITYDPNQIPEESRGIYFRPYATFEKVNLNNGPNVENTTYGTLVGGDSDLIELKHGWDMIWGAYVGYNGSHQNTLGSSIYQNGGTLGLNAAWYKGNFFTGLTANVGASAAEASTMYGNENFTMLSTGIASKTGYNWELFNSKFIIQPSFLISYSFVNTFDYTNAAGVKISSDPLNAIQIVPGIKFIGNLPHGWQPYLGVQMVWSIMDKTKFYANDVGLPQMSVDPYVQYGVGVQKRWGDRFTGFGQAMIRNGGRNGIALQFGFRWSLGKGSSVNGKKQTIKSNPELTKAQISLGSWKNK